MSEATQPVLPLVPNLEPLGTVVVCEDDEATLELLCDHLIADRYDALPAPSAADALRLRKLGTSLPAGSYLTASVFKSQVAGGARPPGGPPQGTTPVEITVTGAGALATSRTGSGDSVDVIVSGDSAPGPSAGRTYVAATGVPLLALREARAEPGLESERWIATLALTREEALRLIRAESIAAQVRLLAG